MEIHITGSEGGGEETTGPKAGAGAWPPTLRRVGRRAECGPDLTRDPSAILSSTQLNGDETGEDLRALQELLDASYARAGSHLLSIWGQETLLDAQDLSAELTGVQVLNLATVTPRGEPRVAPVDGLFFRGHFWFGSAESSARFRNIRANTPGRRCRHTRARNLPRDRARLRG